MRQKWKRNQKGFTLIELVVSAAILGLVGMAALGFMAVGARTYTSINYSLRLQYVSQLAMAQMQNAMMNCNGGMVFQDDTLYILNIDAEDPDNDTLQAFRYDSTDQCIYYGSGSPLAASFSADDLLAEYVTGLSVSFTDAASVDQVKSAEMELQLQRRNKTYSGSQTVALRNLPRTAADLNELLAAIYP